MKFIINILTIIFIAFPAVAQDNSLQPPGDTLLKKDLLLSSMQLNSRPDYSIKDKLMLLNSKEEKEKSEKQEIEKSTTQAEGFKLSTGLLYFAGAAAVAAIIYFLVPDNEPSSEKTYTFGIPVTPK